MAQTLVRYEWQQDWRAARPRSGVSLHSHTSCSLERLDFIPRCRQRCPWLAPLLERYERRYRRSLGCPLDYSAAWWTPPLGPREALRVESDQIERLGLRPLVSITDHDTIEAPLALHLLSEVSRLPVSVEWTVPWRGTVFHLGVHNLPEPRARGLMRQLAAFTASPRASDVEPLLDHLASHPEVLIVLNHPYWDEQQCGAHYHAAMAEQFLARYRRWIHALELNGLRPWKENRRVLDLAARYRLPAVAGGDRHGCEPNALINLSCAADFNTFVDEVRCRRESSILVMKQYREPLPARILAAVADAVGDRQQGWSGVRWKDRVFFRDAGGRVRSLSECFAAGDEPFPIRLFVLLARVGGVPAVRHTVGWILAGGEEFA
ncbi:MAG: hypothetical protein KatS3mg004_0254 [Bryobacteraceae bacterium]|nr:MAG: hypothetical protein KatS3mg004_0254 [Bryobacteraceae bacterium]